MNPASTMNHLPPEILCHVLGYLNLSELIEKKLVCKLWSELISSQLKVKRLIVESYNNWKKERWWHVNRPVDKYLEVCHPHLFLTQLHRPILTSLRHLRLVVLNEDDFNPNDLNAFGQLLQLELHLAVAAQFTKIEWNLPNLKILKINVRRSDSSNQLLVSIDCPKLKVLACNHREKVLFDLKSPETTTTLYACIT